MVQSRMVDRAAGTVGTVGERAGRLAPPHRILLVDDDPSTIELMAKALDGIGDLCFAVTAEEGMALARTDPPDLILMDAQMPGISGFEACRLLKSDPVLAHVPVIFVTSHGEPHFEVLGLDVGAVDFITKPINPPLLLARVRTQLRMKLLADRLIRESTRDVLTGLANRRRFDECLAHEWQRSCRARLPIAFLMLDVDHFKVFNDRHGHPAGDACLRAVGQAIAACVKRPADLCARYGGEEFAVLLPYTDWFGAAVVAARILGAVREARAMPEAPDSAVTASIGMAVYVPTDEAWTTEMLRQEASVEGMGRTLLAAADRALYAAKRAGRDQVHWIALDADCNAGVSQVLKMPGQAIAAAQAR